MGLEDVDIQRIREGKPSIAFIVLDSCRYDSMMLASGELGLLAVFVDFMLLAHHRRKVTLYFDGAHASRSGKAEFWE